MAESYRGLTIRIGGDTTKLTQALHTANQAISGTQSSMRKLSDALKMDPTSLKASQLQVGEFAAQASNAATRLVTLNDAMKQVGDEIRTFNGSAATVREMANSWGNVNMVASQTRDYYEALTKTLATTYTEFSKTYSEASKMASIDMAKGFSLEYGNFGDMAKQIKEVAAAFNANDDQVKRFSEKLEKISQRYDELVVKQEQYQEIVDNGDVGSKEFEKAANQLAKVNEQLEKTKARFASAIESFKGFKSDEFFKFDADNTDLASLAKSLYQMVEAEAMTAEQADKLWDSIARMKDMWESAFENVKTANVVEGFHDLEAEAAKAEAKVASLVNQLVEAARTDATQGIAKLEEKLKAVTTAGNNASTRLKEAFDVLKNSLGDGSGKASEAQMMDSMRAYADSVAAATGKVELLEEQISKLSENENVANLAASTNSLVAESQQAEQGYNEMAEAVTRYEAALHGVEDEMSRIADDNPAYENDEHYQELAKQAEAYHEILTITYASADTAKQKFTEMTQALTLRDKLHDLETAKSALQQLQQINIKPEVDLSALDGMKKAIESMSQITLNADGLSKFREGVKQTASVMSDAEKRYKALSEAAKKDPTNSETILLRTKALQEVTQATTAHIEAMQAELAAIPSDRVDQAALAAGKAEENYRQAKEEVDKYKTALVDINDRIEAMTKQRNDLQVHIVKSEDVLLVNKMTREIEELKQRRDALAATGDAAWDNLVVAENTRQVQQHSVAIQQDEARLHELGEEARKTHLTDATPKIDEAAFMQVVDRITQAMQRMGGEIVQASNQIDTAYRDMRKTVNGTEEDYERLRDAAIQYSKDSFTSADQMLEMQALGGQLGVATENLEQFGRIASNLDIATDIDAETVALKLGQISNVLGLDIEGMQGFSDALVRLGNNMPAQESAIMAVAQRFGAVAATANFSGEEVLGWSAAIAATGQRSEAAATAISNTVSGIEQAVANGGSDLKQFAAIAGMSADEFKKAWQDSPTEVLRAFIDGLKNLKDNNVSAVAALENMGITGVRQQQTLLALTQTIDSLDDALLMSKDAWHGIDDQWGQSGDAAIEAGRKAEGFSGALQILKNNAQNLAASFGDGMVRPMNVLADAIGIVTDALNSMPPFLKEIVVMLATTGIAFSTVTPLLNVFGKGIGTVIASFAQSASIGDFIVKMTGVEGVLMGAAQNGVNLVSVFTNIAPQVLAVSAAFGALAVVGGYLSDLYERQQLLEQSTTGLTTAVSSMKEAYENYIPESAVLSVEELQKKSDEVLESQASLAENMSEKWADVGVAAAMVDDLSEKIIELSEKSQLTKDEQYELNAAVQAYNDVTGSSIKVLDDVTGKLNISSDALRDNASAWKERAESEAAFEMYKDVVKQRIKNELALAEATKTLEAEEAKAKETTTNLWGGMSFATASAGQAREEVERLEASINSNSEAEKQLIDMMSGGEKTITRIREALKAAGESTEEFDSLTKSEMLEVAKSFDGSAASIIAAIERIKAAAAGVASETSDALDEASKEAIKKQYDAAKVAADIEYKAAKRSADAAYKQQQRAFDAAYKQQQRAYDAQYKDLKNALDKQYNARKKAYDHEYDALKRKLDAEEKELKQGNDAKLKALKNQNDAEEREFKAATDAYLHELEVRYKATIKTLEDETDAKVKAIDEQIRALKGQTTAEQNAVKEMKEDDKLATLQQDIVNAKSRRKREEAEKKYNMYLAEVTADRNERERKDQIAALELEKSNLKDALATRKEDIKAAYDEDKYQYKLSRDAMLEDLKLANDAEYDALKLKLENEAQLQKDHNDIVLAQLKEQQDASLEALKTEHQTQLDNMKAEQQASLDAIKVDQTAQLDAMKAEQEAVLDAMKRRQDAELAAIKEGGTAMEEEESAQLKAHTGHMQGMANATETNGAQMVSGLRKKFQAMLGITDSGGGSMAETTGKHAAAIESHMGEMNRNIVKTSGQYQSTLNEDTNKALTELDKAYGNYGEKSPKSFKHGFDEVDLGNVAQMKADSVFSPFGDIPPEMYTSGWDMLEEFNDGVCQAWNQGGLTGTIDYISQWIRDRMGFSVPKYGPMSDADKWGPDMIYLITDGIKSKEHILLHQIQKMSDAMEEAFDPTLSVDAAFEALDEIGKNRSASLGAIVETNSAPTVTINLSMNLADVSIRSDADIDRLARVLSQEMAAQATRQLAGRLG